MNKYEEKQLIDQEWKKLKRIHPELCNRLDREREIWFKNLKKEAKNKTLNESVIIKAREFKKIIEKQDESIKRINKIYREYDFEELKF